MSVWCAINSNLSGSPDTDKSFEQLANCNLLLVFFRNFLLPNVWCFIRNEAVPEPHKNFRVRIRNAALNRSFKNGTVSLRRKRKKILGWALIIGAMCFSFTNFVISKLKGKIAVWSPYLIIKSKEARVRIKMKNMIRICWKISGTQLWTEQPHLHY